MDCRPLTRPRVCRDCKNDTSETLHRLYDIYGGEIHTQIGEERWSGFYITEARRQRMSRKHNENLNVLIALRQLEDPEEEQTFCTGSVDEETEDDCDSDISYGGTEEESSAPEEVFGSDDDDSSSSNNGIPKGLEWREYEAEVDDANASFHWGAMAHDPQAENMDICDNSDADFEDTDDDWDARVADVEDNCDLSEDEAEDAYDLSDNQVREHLESVLDEEIL